MKILIEISKSIATVNVIEISEYENKNLHNVLKSISSIYPWYIGSDNSLLNFRGFLKDSGLKEYDMVNFKKRLIENPNAKN